MANESQRDIEKALLAYKQRRGEQAGAPLELHPATRKLLQGEVARTANRPLLTSEEAAKNFVRSFVMSHQQPGFFARHKQRVIWGGAMFACLALVLAVLRNDPQRRAQDGAFRDALPMPVPITDPQSDKPQATVAANNLQPLGVVKKSAAAVNRTPDEAARLSRDKREAQVSDSLLESAKRSGALVGGPAVASPRPAAATSTGSGPTPALRRETERLSGTPNAPLPASPSVANNVRTVNAPAPTTGRALMKAESNVTRGLDRDADRKSAEQPAAGELDKLAKSLKDGESAELKADFAAKKARAELKGAVVSDDFKRARALGAAGGAGSGGGSPAPPAAPVAEPVAATATAPLGQTLAFSSGEAQVRQQFLQVDTRASLRPSFTAKPPPEVMKDFAFERIGDRVRIVDADGSTYDGTVVPALVEEEARLKVAARADAAKATNLTLGLQTQGGDQKPAEAPLAYRFIATGVNRKLNQSVEFRGEWQPAAPSPTGAMPALQPASFGIVALEAESAAEKKEKALVTNSSLTLSDQVAPTQHYFFQGVRKSLSPGSISGRAVVGGKEEFDIKAVTK